MMRIGVDVRELLGRPTGVGRYVLHLLVEWATAARKGAFPHQIVLYSPAECPPETAAAFDALAPERRIVPGSPGTWWEQVQLPPVASRDRLNVFFAPAYTAPLRITCPVVQTIHDLSFLAHPEWFSLRERLRRAWLTRSSARRARIVLTDSRFSAGEIRGRLGIPDDRIRVIPLGLTTPGQSTTPGVIVPSAWPTFGERRPIVLYVGSVFNRRRVPDLIRAFAHVAARVPDARLEIVGENRTHPTQDLAALCRTLNIADRVVVRAYVSDDELVGLYRSARVFAFLSEYEGFGLTPLEALSCGIPVVVLDTPVARETCGAAACYVGPGDTEEVATHLTRLLSDERAHREALAPAAELLARYSWPDAARATLDALEAAAR
ncbi:MAG: glycosyltransferase family 1 protein [Acidobacteria bacterium]|nr:glycosyltransferase family 1 protein [Acidobacteriota bacterium]